MADGRLETMASSTGFRPTKRVVPPTLFTANYMSSLSESQVSTRYLIMIDYIIIILLYYCSNRVQSDLARKKREKAEFKVGIWECFSLFRGKKNA